MSAEQQPQRLVVADIREAVVQHERDEALTETKRLRRQRDILARSLRGIWQAAAMGVTRFTADGDGLSVLAEISAESSADQPSGDDETSEETKCP